MGKLTGECPFCGEQDFDAIGLKAHLTRGWCEDFNSTPELGRTALREKARRLLAEVSSDTSETDSGFSEGMILAASVVDVADEEIIAAELAYELEFVRLVGSRLRTAGIWKGTSLNPVHLAAWQEDGDLAFILDWHVATGAMEVARVVDDQPRYRATESGAGEVKKLLRRL